MLPYDIFPMQFQYLHKPFIHIPVFIGDTKHNVSREQAQQKAEAEYAKYKAKVINEPSKAETDY